MILAYFEDMKNIYKKFLPYFISPEDRGNTVQKNERGSEKDEPSMDNIFKAVIPIFEQTIKNYNFKARSKPQQHSSKEVGKWWQIILYGKYSIL